MLIVQDNHGCLDTTLHEICIREWTFYIPNAFTPNGNGKNDFFFGAGIGITEYQLWIFDRWGNLIFECHVNDLPQTFPCMWDGKVRGGPSDAVVQEDVYVWKVKLTNVLTDIHTYVGTVTVVK
jgi:gliding motility-associated-like protein